MPSPSSGVASVRHDAPVTVVVDEDDDPAFSDQLDRRADVATGVIVVRPVPGVVDKRRLATDVLIALGKHYDCLSRERGSSRGWHLARLWTRAEGVRHLVVWDAHRLPARLHGELAGIASASNSRLWLVVRPEELGSFVPPGGCTPDQLLAQLPVPGGATVTDPVLDDRLVLPQESFLTFRWACLHRLGPGQFALVDAVYVAAHEATRRWLEGRHWRDRPRVEEVVRQLRELTAASVSSAETLVRLRAAQAAYFRDGALVQTDDSGLWARPDVPAVALPPPLAARLRRLVTPVWACALALAACAGLSAGDLARLKVGDLGSDGTLLALGGERFDIPGHAAGLVRAQLLASAEQNACADDPLLGKPFETAPLARRLDSAARFACVWRPSDERRPLWHPAPALGHVVQVIPLAANWEAAASP